MTFYTHDNYITNTNCTCFNLYTYNAWYGIGSFAFVMFTNDCTKIIISDKELLNAFDIHSYI